MEEHKINDALMAGFESENEYKKYLAELHERECWESPDGKHKRTMLKSGLNPEYGCQYCHILMPGVPSKEIKRSCRRQFEDLQKDRAFEVIKNLRNEVVEFAQDMERILKENDHKTGWDEMSYHQLFNRIKIEFEEFQREYILTCNRLDGDNKGIAKMRKEAIDIANFCMFFCHNYPRGEQK